MESCQQKVIIHKRNAALEAMLEKHMGPAFYPIAEALLGRNAIIAECQDEPKLVILFEAQTHGLIMHECVGQNSRFDVIEKACNVGLQLAKLADLPALFAYTPRKAVERHIERLGAEYVGEIDGAKWYKKNVIKQIIH